MQQKLLTTILLFLCLFSCTKEAIELPKEILSFEVAIFGSSKAVIDPVKKTISLKVPYNTSIKEITPVIKANEGVNIIPASGTKQDFSKPVYYTLTANDNSKVIYTVKIEVEEQPTPEIFAFETDSVEAGKSTIITGKFFGNFQLDVSVFLINNSNQPLLLANNLIDSSKIKIEIPLIVLPDNYKIQVKIKSKTTISVKNLYIQYPSPQLIEVSQKNLLQGDTVWLRGKYIDYQKYLFSLLLDNSGRELAVKNLKNIGDKLYFLVNSEVTAAKYQVKVLNKTEKKKSIQTEFDLTVYSQDKPYLKGFSKSKYKKTETVEIKTYNFDKVPTRFYQLQLISGSKLYFINGIFDSKKKLLILSLPENIQSGDYTLSMSFVNNEGKIDYQFQIDNLLVIE